MIISFRHGFFVMVTVGAKATCGQMPSVVEAVLMLFVFSDDDKMRLKLRTAQDDRCFCYKAVQ